jgi:hypothetical protein
VGLVSNCAIQRILLGGADCESYKVVSARADLSFEAWVQRGRGRRGDSRSRLGTRGSWTRGVPEGISL